MPYLVVDNFSAGLDSRRHVLNSKDGTLAVLKNAHITRGGEIEKRKAFSQFAALPANTFGLESTADKIYVFGSAEQTTMPAGLTYQRLQHPDGLAMTKIIWSTVYGGLPFVIAEYTDNKRYCFWNGAIIKDWFAGQVRSSMSNQAGIVSHLASTFSLPGYTCVASNNKLTITGPLSTKFTVSTSNTPTGGMTVENNVNVTEVGNPETLASTEIQTDAGFSQSLSAKMFIRAKSALYNVPNVIGIYVATPSVTADNLGSSNSFNSSSQKIPFPAGVTSFNWTRGANWLRTTEGPTTWFLAIDDIIYKGFNENFDFSLNLPNTTHLLKSRVEYNTSSYTLQQWPEGGYDPDGEAALKIESVPRDGASTTYTYRNGKNMWFEFDSDPNAASGIHQIIVMSSITQVGTSWFAKLRRDPFYGEPIEKNDYDPIVTIEADPATGVTPARPSFNDAPIAATFGGGLSKAIVDIKLENDSMVNYASLGGVFISVGQLYDTWWDPVGGTPESPVRYGDPDKNRDKVIERINAFTNVTGPNGHKTIASKSPGFVGIKITGKPGTADSLNGKRITVFYNNESDELTQKEAAKAYHWYWKRRPSYPVVSYPTRGPFTLSGGAAGVPAVSQVTTVTLNRGFNVGDIYSISISDPTQSNPYVFGGSRVTGKVPEFAVTYKSKEYAASGSTMFFSALNDATKWGIYDLGSGFIDMSNNFGGREPLTGFGVYQNNLAVFSRRNVQLWFLDADPSQNQQRQILANTGCRSPDSVVSMGSIDLLYLADNGIRSLRARENTDTAFASDIGSPIDSIVIEHMATLTEDQIQSSRAVVEPLDGRYWLAIGDKVFVLSYFPGSSISAWSMYEPGFSITDMAVKDDKVYARSGNTIYVYGGSDGVTYDSCQVVVELPYLDGKKPATFKRCKGVDVTIQGEWKIHMGFDHTNPNARDLIATPNQPTFALGKIDAVGVGTHFGLRMTSQYPGYARIANVIVHFDEMQAKHEAG